MNLIDLDKVVIRPNRQRTDFDPMMVQEISQSIQSKQLLHAPVLREENGQFVLVAGETRIRAIKDMWMLGGVLKYNNVEIPEGKIPYVTLGELDELSAEEAELEENIKRKDLSWKENASAMERLHSLRSRQAQAQGRVHTIADTAMEVKGRSDGSYQEAIRRDVILAKHLDNPIIAKAKDAKEAFSILKRQEATAKHVELAATVGKTFNHEVHKLHNINCLTWMRGTDERFDVILTDPPYGMGADTFGDGGGKLANSEHHYKDDYDSWLRLMEEWCPLSYQVAKPEAHAYVFCDLDNFHKLKDLMRLAGWYVFRTPFICVKPGSGRVPLPTEGPRRQWEMLLYAIKGHKAVNAIVSDVIVTTGDPNMGHGAQKPVATYVDLLRRSVKPGDTVLDSFAGSGTVFPAAHQLKVVATGLEMNPEYYSMGMQRIKALQSPEQEAQGRQLIKELQGMG